MNSLIAQKWFYRAGALGALALLASCNRSTTASSTAETNLPSTVTNASAAVAPDATPAATSYYVQGELPPPPPPEAQPPSPGPDYVWVAGYYGWNNGRHEWMRGRWERPPHPHAVWVEPRWERRDRGHVFVRGYWRDDERERNDRDRR